MKKLLPNLTITLFFAILFFGCTPKEHYEVIIKNGNILDGSGNPSYTGDIGLNADTIAAMGDLSEARGELEIDAEGLAVAPGFINMMCWANVSLIEDGRSQGDIRQGVTLEVLGEGTSMGPLNDSMKTAMKENQGDIRYDVEWTTLGEYLEFLEKKGVSPNVASFVGNGTLRLYTMGYKEGPPSDEEMEKMKELTREAMEEGAVGLSTALIYAPSGHASTEEIIELAKVVAEYDGLYATHLRSEEAQLLEAIQELITVSREAGIRSEIYHFKASGTDNWDLMDEAIEMINRAREEGLPITTDMYMYNASSTGLNTLLPDWGKAGGHGKTIEYIEDPETRQRLIEEIDFHIPPDKVLLVGFRNEELRKYTGQNLADVASDLKVSPEEAIVDLIYKDDSRIQSVFFSMNEENVKKKLALPYMSICSDAGSYSAEGVFLKQSTHPRAYGSFARLLGKYVREEKIISLEEAIRRLTSLPAVNMKINKRGSLIPGYYADLAIFDPNEIRDNATFEDPHQYATGMVHVFVNGEQVIKDGEHTGALPGRFVRGPGWGKNHIKQ